jgi:hypothetical protein
MATPPRVIHEFEVGRGTVRSTLNEFGGRVYFDVRLWVEPRDQTGAALIPTKRGLSLPLEFLPEIREALEAIGEATKRDQGELAGRQHRLNASGAQRWMRSTS